MISESIKIKHLLNRACFGIDPKEYDSLNSKSLRQTKTMVFNSPYSPIDFKKGDINSLVEKIESRVILTKEEKQGKRVMLFSLQNEWMRSMMSASHIQSPFRDRMSLFWHGHFACRTKDFRIASNYLESIRKNALGSFRDLLYAMAKDAGMIKYLNNQQNIKGAPNENFGRELLELFTMGIGNYTEKDIKEAARAFTGWSANAKGDFLVRRKLHDSGQKTFLGKKGNFGGEDIIEIILERRETAVFIAGKIYKYFVNDTLNEKHVRELADEFYTKNYNIEAVMLKLFNSSWFYDEKNIGTKVKSPIDLIVGTQKLLKIEFTQITNIVYLQRILGQELFDPPNVAGWKRDLKWLNNSTLVIRLNLLKILLGLTDLQVGTKDEAEGVNFDRKIRNRFRSVQYDGQELLRVLGKFEESTVEAILEFSMLPKGEFPQGILRKSAKLNLTKEELIERIINLSILPEYQFC